MELVKFGEEATTAQETLALMEAAVVPERIKAQTYQKALDSAEYKRKKTTEKYKKMAEKFYKKLRKKCKDRHAWESTSRGGYGFSVMTCALCKVPKEKKDKDDRYRHAWYEYRELAEHLSKILMQKDFDSGVIVKEIDYPDLPNRADFFE